MQVSITQMRKDLFRLAENALDGVEVWVLHKGRRLKLVPEQPAGSKLERITPLAVMAPGFDALDDPALKAEMERALEEDWKTL